MPRPAQNRGFQLGIVLLIAELFFSIGLSNIPPVTLGAIVSATHIELPQSCYVGTFHF